MGVCWPTPRAAGACSSRTRRRTTRCRSGGGPPTRLLGGRPRTGDGRMILATIDVGTNPVLLLVARAKDGQGPVEVIEERAEITRLGRGIGVDGRLGAQGIDLSLAALRQFAAVARQHGARIAVVGTEALRRAPNAAEFLTPAEAILGVPV